MVKRYLVLILAVLFMAVSIGFVLPALVSAKSDLALAGAVAWALLLMPGVGVAGVKIFKKTNQTKETES